MRKINLMLLLSLLLSISFTKGSSNNFLNQKRKLNEDYDEEKKETILLGMDNYQLFPNGANNYTVNFNIYFLFKNWNYLTYQFKDIEIKTIINCTDKTQIPSTFICIYDYKADNISEEGDFVKFDFVAYQCESTLKGKPKLINITTNFSEYNPVNNSGKFYVSSSFEVFKKDLIGMKDKKMFDPEKICILRNSTILSKNSPYLKIQGGKDDHKLSYGWDSENIELLTNSHGYPKKIPFSGKYKKDNSDDKDYYFLDSKGASNIYNTDLNYALMNYTKLEKILILDFQEGEKSLITQENVIKKKSGGLSTGGIVAIVIPSVVVLLGVAGLAFFLSRRAVPPIPVKNVANNTIGVASSEAVVHQ